MKLNNDKYNMKTKKIAILFFISVSVLNAQGLFFKSNDFFNTIFDSKSKVNSYYVGENPSYLNLEENDERLIIQSYYNGTDGDFKSFFDPGASQNSQLSFSGKKQITENQIFKGSFTLQNEQRRNWDWLATKYYKSGSPFLFGDSTSGKTRYNSILMNAEYSGEVFNNFNIGFSLLYGVDDGLKTVTPRPISEHRDIFFNVGINYLISQNHSVGLVFKTYDFNEKIIYKEDKGGVYQETILFKFRGYDSPLKFLKKRESRYSYHNGYIGSLTYQHSSKNLKLALVGSIGLENISLSDGSTDPLPEGYWKNDFLESELKLLYMPSKSISCGLSYNYNLKKMWARHPIFKSTLMENETPNHSISAGVEIEISKDLLVGAEMSAELLKNDYSDYYSNIYWKNNKLILSPQIGISYKWTEWLYTFGGYEYQQGNVEDSDITTYDPSIYYNSYTAYDIQYTLSDYTAHKAFLKTTIIPAGIGEFNLYMIYNELKSENESYFKGKTRSSITGVLEFRIATY